MQAASHLLCLVACVVGLLEDGGGGMRRLFLVPLACLLSSWCYKWDGPVVRMAFRSVRGAMRARACACRQPSGGRVTNTDVYMSHAARVRCAALGCFALRWNALHCAGMHCDGMGCCALRYDSLRCAAVRYAALRFDAVQFVA